MLLMSTSDTYHHGNLRTALLDAAGEILEQQGLEALSLREAARRAGVSHNAPYRHFANREALLAALAAEGFAELGGALGRAGGPEAGASYVSFALHHPQRFRLMFGGVVSTDAHPELREQAARAFDGLQRSFSGTGPPERAAHAAAAAWSLVHGLAELLLNGHLRRAAGEDPVEYARNVIGTVRFAVVPGRGD